MEDLVSQYLDDEMRVHVQRANVLLGPRGLRWELKGSAWYCQGRRARVADELWCHSHELMGWDPRSER